MNTDALMDEIAETLKGIEGLRVTDYRAGVIYPPAIMVPLPAIRFDETYGRGVDVHEYDLPLFAGGAGARTAVSNVSPYTTGTGPKSVKAILEGHQWVACDWLVVKSIEFMPADVAGTTYLAAVFAAEACGPGS